MFPGFNPLLDAETLYPSFVELASQFSALRYMWATLTLDPDYSVTSWEQVAPEDYYTFGDVLRNSLSPAWLVRISNETGTDPWITIPHAVDDEYVGNLAQLLEERLDNDRKNYIEYGNELWNTSPHYFPGYRYTTREAWKSLPFLKRSLGPRIDW